MKVGVPLEIKPLEGRVGLIPAAAGELVSHGHEVFIQSGAGKLSGYQDSDYERVGVSVVENAQTLYAEAELIVKVKEPIEGDLQWLRKEHLLFCYLHLAPNPELTKALLGIGLTAVAFETVTDGQRLPLLAPMSQIAGRVAVDAGSHYLHQSMGGKGVLLGGVPGTDRGKVVVLGAGVAGSFATAAATEMGAEVVVFDKAQAAIDRVRQLGANVTALYAYRDRIAQELRNADLVIGAVLIPGARAPRVINRDMISEMEPGSVLVDISIDQGGCIETMRPTDYTNPTYVEAGLVHMAVTNLPGAVPRSASQALSGAILPYALELASGRLDSNASLKAGINVKGGKLVHPQLTACFDF